jgi:WD40 repeat protein
MKLWDLRMVMSPRDFGALRPSRRRAMERNFDYRWGAYDEDDWYRDPNDNSLVTFRGHRVLRTLIRCHFSPPGSTNSRYVYSGSEDGQVYIWNMDATLAGKVDVYGATKNSRPPHRGHEMMGANLTWKTCVRDASWHPNAPMIVGTYLTSRPRCARLICLQHRRGTAMACLLEPALYIRGMTGRKKTRPSQEWVSELTRNWKLIVHCTGPGRSHGLLACGDGV